MNGVKNLGILIQESMIKGEEDIEANQEVQEEDLEAMKEDLLIEEEREAIVVDLVKAQEEVEVIQEEEVEAITEEEDHLLEVYFKKFHIYI